MTLEKRQGMSSARRLVGDGKAQDLLREGEAFHERFGHAIGDVEHAPPHPLEGLTDHHGTRRTVCFGRPRSKDVETGGDQDEAGVLGEEPRGLAAEVRGQVWPKRGDTALVVLEDDVLDRHEGQNITRPGALARKSAQV
jgi:hypothetical protein